MRSTLGTLDGGGVVLIDVARLVQTRLLVQANSGGGKSWALRRLLEQTHGSVQQLIIDPEGEFASLRERFDYVLAGKGGDTVTDYRAARLLAERLLEHRVSAILDIYELKAHERVWFVRDFLNALVDAPKKLWHPALVVLDEAHVFAPEKDSAESRQSVIDLATRGRKRGFCLIPATQRLAKLDKDVAAECNNKLIGRTGLDVDIKRAADELGFAKDRWPELRMLRPGHFFAYGPALTVTGRGAAVLAKGGVLSVRVGDVRTTHPSASGRRRAFRTPPPSRKIRGLLPKLADLPKEAEEQASTATELKREIVELRRQLRERPVDVYVGPAATRVVERPMLKAAQVKAMERVIARAGKLGERVAAAAGGIQAAAADLAGALSRAQAAQKAQPAALPPRPAPRLSETPREPAQERRKRPVAAGAATPTAGNGVRITGPEQRILDALAWLESIGMAVAQESAAAFLAGYTTGGGAFNNPRGALRAKGLIEYRGGADRLALTAAGRAIANQPPETLTAPELQRRVMQRLPGPEQRILGELLKRYPLTTPNNDLARSAGYEPGGGAFNNPRGRLKSLGLIEYRGGGQIRASPVLFLEGG